MNKVFIILSAILISACASTTTSRFSYLSDNELLSISERILKEPYIKYCKRVLPIAKEILSRDPENVNKKQAMHFAEYKCAAKRSQWKKAYSSLILSKQDNGLIGFEAAYKANHLVDALTRLKSIAKDSASLDILKINTEIFWDIYQNLTEESAQKLKKEVISAIGTSPHFQQFNDLFQREIALIILSNDMSGYEIKDFNTWINYVSDSRTHIQLLADKQYQDIWPQLEAHVGPNLKKSTGNNVLAFQKVFDQHQNNLLNRLGLAQALLFDSKFEKVIDLVKAPTENLKIDEHTAWLLDTKVYALEALNMKKEANATSRLLAYIPVNEKNRHWLISFAINHASYLCRQKKWKECYLAAEYAEKFRGTDYAEMLILHLKAESLIEQGKSQLAQPILIKLYNRRKDSYISVVDAMISAGKTKIAAKVAIEALNDDSYRSQMLQHLQKGEFSLRFITSSDLYLKLSLNAEFVKVFNEKGRRIPDRYMLKPNKGLLTNT